MTARGENDSLRFFTYEMTKEELLSYLEAMNWKGSLKAVEAIRAAGCEVVGMAAIFTYEFPIAVENFRNAGVTLRTLSNYNSMLDAALATNYIKAEDIETLKEWRKDPANWVPANPNAE